MANQDQNEKPNPLRGALIGGLGGIVGYILYRIFTEFF